MIFPRSFFALCLLSSSVLARGRVLLSAFEPFGWRQENSSQAAVLTLVRQLRAQPDPAIPAEVDFIVLPVSYERAADELLRKMETYRPDVVVSVGEIPGREFGLERWARNHDASWTPNSDGAWRLNDTIIEGGPESLPTGLPIEGIQRDLVAAGFAAKLSDSAGSYVCNHLFYSVLYAISSEPAFAGVRAGFVHVPVANIEEDRQYPEGYANMMRRVLRRAYAP